MGKGGWGENAQAWCEQQLWCWGAGVWKEAQEKDVNQLLHLTCIWSTATLRAFSPASAPAAPLLAADVRAALLEASSSTQPGQPSGSSTAC